MTRTALTSPNSPSLWLLLALLIEQPCSGPDLIARYRQRFQLLAPRGRGDLGPIRRLEELAYIEPLPPGAPSRPPSVDETGICFVATPAGAAAHKQWLSWPIDESRWRVEILARIATGAELGPHGLLELIKLYHQHAAADVDRAERRFDDANATSLSGLAAELASQEQLDTLIIQRDWAERALRAVQEHGRREGDR